MAQVCCKECGLYFEDGDKSMCYKTNECLEALEQDSCAYFISVQMDGNVPYTPAQHIFMLEASESKKKMKYIQGLRF